MSRMCPDKLNVSRPTANARDSIQGKELETLRWRKPVLGCCVTRE